MSNNVTQFPQKAQLPLWRKILRYLLIVLAVFLVLVPTLLWEQLDLDRPLRKLRYGASQSVSFDSHLSNHYAMCNDALLVSANGNVKLCPLDGKASVLTAVKFSSPLAVGSGRYALGVDLGGRSYVFAEAKKRQLTAQTLSGDILDVDVRDTGVYCIASTEGGYKTVLRLFGKDGQETFRWFSASQYLPLCACSPNGRQMAAVAFDVVNGSYRSQILFFRTDSAEIAATATVSDALVYDLRYFDNNTLCVVSEDGVRVYANDGSIRGEWTFEDRLIDYDLSSDRFALLAFDSAVSSESTTLVTLDHAARMLGQATVSGKCRGISANGRYAALLTDGELLIYRSNLSLYAQSFDVSDARDVFVRSDGSTLLVGDKKAELVLP